MRELLLVPLASALQPVRDVFVDRLFELVLCFSQTLWTRRVQLVSMGVLLQLLEVQGML